MKKKHLQLNIVLSALAVVFAILVLGITAESSILESVSLEQSLRCSRQEHVHSEECYTYDVLTCKLETHIHSKNCFLVLLDDNDIHVVLKETERVEEKTLESVIENTIDNALNYNPAIISGEAVQPERAEESEQTERIDYTENFVLDTASISELNEVVRTENELPNLVFNEELNHDDEETTLSACS